MRTDEIARRIGGRLDGEPREARRLLSPGGVADDAIVVASDQPVLERCRTADGAESLAALVVPEDTVVDAPHPPLLRHPNPRLALAAISRLLDEEPTPPPGIHATAVVAVGATIAADARIGPFVRIGAGARIGSGCLVDAGTTVGEGCRVGDGTRLFPNVVLYPRVRIGARCRVHAGAVLGADGFGYEPGPAGASKIHHLGGVRVGDDVEIGAGTCIDRGTLNDTEIGDGSKIDNLCQIAHNVRVGRHCLIAGGALVGGSSRIEDGCMLGGGVAVSDHVTIHAGARIAGRSGVTKDVPPGEAWGGLPAGPMRRWARERYLVGRLERIWAFVRDAER